MSEQNKDTETGLQYLHDLGAEIAGLYHAVKADMPDANEEEIRAEMRERYVRYHNPALFRVGVELSAEQEATIRSAIEQGEIRKAQQIVLDELGKQFPGKPE